MEWISRIIHRKAAFVYPVLPAPRTAVLESCFRSNGFLRVFENGWCAEAEAYRPAAIAATWPHWESLLNLNIESLTHAAIVLARPEAGLLTLAQRQRLWRAFRVPIFEQLIGDRGLLLAAECQAHAGLHIESPKFRPAGRPMETHILEIAVCGCGRTTPRLKPIEQFEEIRAIAAYAR